MIKKILFAGLFAISTVACGGDECDDAADKAEECNLEGSGEGSSDDVECSGQIECVAKCINEASCEDLKSTDINNSYFKCAAACGE
jgi:hypothetical protein